MPVPPLAVALEAAAEEYTSSFVLGKDILRGVLEKDINEASCCTWRRDTKQVLRLPA